MTDDVLDPITGLHRITALDHTHEPPWLAAMPPDTVVLRIDLREFSDVNRAYGMEAGDALLAEMARRLQAAAQPWPAYRVGGDEFLVIARLVDDDAVRRFAGVIRTAMEQPYEIGAVWTAMGAARAFPGATRDLLYRMADTGVLLTRRDPGSSDVVLVKVEDMRWYGANEDADPCQ